MAEFDIAEFLMTMTALILGVAVHDGAQALMAYRLGDETPRREGRMTLWPPVHLDPLGIFSVMLLSAFGFSIGWGRPMPSEPANYPERPRLCVFLATLAGPFANLLVAVLFAFVYRSGVFPKEDAFQAWTLRLIFFNVALFLFHLLVPLYRMDAVRLISLVLPKAAGEAWDKFHRWFGLPLLILLLMSPLTARWFIPAIASVAARLVGAGPLSLS